MAGLTFLATLVKAELTAEQREQLRVLLRAQAHPYITPEIRRELFQQQQQQQPGSGRAAEGDGDDSSMRLG